MNIKSITRLENSAALKLPFYDAGVKAGFPSPADDHLEKHIDLNEELVRHPSATFFVQVSGQSMKDAGIIDGDRLVVDRSLKPKNGQVIVAFLNGEFTVKYFEKSGNRICLNPANVDFKPIEVKPSDEFEVWGIVVHAIHDFPK